MTHTTPDLTALLAARADLRYRSLDAADTYFAATDNGASDIECYAAKRAAQRAAYAVEQFDKAHPEVLDALERDRAAWLAELDRARAQMLAEMDSARASEMRS